MRIYGPNGTTTSTSSGPARRTGSSTFSLPTSTTTQPEPEARAVHAPLAPTGLEALLAMQGVEDATERRKRSVARGRSALDVLDDLKIGLLAGTFNPATVARLRAAAAELKTSSGDPGLDAVLSEIELRVEVELAKAGQY
ncbi:flagellar assembly protein FliX [Rhodopseudomonas telluris]|uniref:Flagellar assembly protein FliX n=1 Tax=Rhodopseudomonas telluris TaxID=644215 RepID=A0ABV6ETQ9_9BRAD